MLAGVDVTEGGDANVVLGDFALGQHGAAEHLIDKNYPSAWVGRVKPDEHTRQ